jgi:hypothetical protein
LDGGDTWNNAIGSSLPYGTGGSTHYNGKIWVVTGTNGTNRVAHSLDGINWTGVLDTTAALHVVYGAGKWILTNNTTTVRYSTDGINWTSYTSSMVVGNSFGRVKYNGSVFIAGSSSGIIRSFNGLDYSIVSTSTGGYDYVYGNGRWIMCYNTINNWRYSDDNGITWDELTNLTGYSSTNLPSSTPSLAYSTTDNRWVAVGSTTPAYSNDDGLNWTLCTGINNGTGITWGGNGWVASTSVAATEMYISSNGIAWTVVSADIFIGGFAGRGPGSNTTIRSGYSLVDEIDVYKGDIVTYTKSGTWVGGTSQTILPPDLKRYDCY